MPTPQDFSRFITSHINTHFKTLWRSRFDTAGLLESAHYLQYAIFMPFKLAHILQGGKILKSNIKAPHIQQGGAEDFKKRQREVCVPTCNWNVKSPLFSSI